ncbi:MAG: hypothetical protein ALECFALPRED_004853 [Alectoria fallacina]|uniref:C2H2-type domain-containing protein n=1 Tax=Alectoria fallacina TaxID=1903189 RepID=A0A8H3HVI2_9LECA|nr:MAG: hypothetical protein ALECFALPRED_004853 [Alectoria fallacina]
MPPTSIAIDPASETYNTASSANADLNQLLLPSPGLEGPSLPRPAYPSQINDLEPLTQDPQSLSVGHHEPEPNPSLNSYPEPWNQQFVNNGGPFQYPMSRAYSSAWGRMNHPSPRPQCWPYSPSEMDCSISGRYPPDSAYCTKSPATQSIFSGEFPASSQQSLAGAMNAMELPNEQMPYMLYPTEGLSRVSQEAQCSYAERSYPENPTESTQQWLCADCQSSQTFKNKSEFNKHQLRHQKPFKCDVPGCNRETGFTTKNDLDRHKKSIHQVYIGKSYMCAAPHCAKKNKIWPRADNFRQHIIRLHRDWNVQELMDKSWERGCSMTQGDSGRGFVHSLELCQQSIYEDDGTTEHDIPYLVTLQEIHKSSSVDSISNPYQQETGHSSATSQDSANLYSASSQDVGDLMDLDQRTVNQYHTAVIPDDEYVPPAPERCLAMPRSNFEKLSLPPKRKQPVVHRPKDCPDSSAWTDAQRSQPTSTEGSRTLAISANEASQAIASDLSKAGYRSKEEMELVIRTSVLSLLSANKSRKRSPQDSPCRELTDLEKRLECRFCHKKKKTQCDLTKHLKRHTRPYGCTFTGCPRRFGSKNDWKRHENTMHYQVEAWKCAEPKIPDGSDSAMARDKSSGTNEATSSRQCGRLCYRRELFMAHLHEAHHLADPEYEQYVKDQCRKRRVGRNGQCGFWCGFCQTVVRLEKTGIEAWDERFNHIDDEHFKKGNRVEGWVPLEGEVPRGVLELAGVCDLEKEAREAEDKGSDEEDSGPDAEGEGDIVVLEAGGSEEREAKAKAAAVARVRSTSNVAGLESKGRVRRLWDCCKCGGAELSRDTDLMCYWEECNHRRCDRCKINDRVLESEVEMMGNGSFAA